jgi:carboxypeptidase family protein/TonB-dependent receptor-like protein
MLSPSIIRKFIILFLPSVLSAGLCFGQFEAATVTGQVSDPSGLNIAGAQVNLVDIDRGSVESATTDRSGLYRFASVHPGRYRIQVRAVGFKVIDLTGLVINVQDHLEQNFSLTMGSVSESITVSGGAPLVNTESATVSTVIDRNFADKLPLNGRSFQTLIELSPGVVLTPSNGYDAGQFSVNGQRASANYWTVDGVGANIGVSSNAIAGQGLAGALPSFSVQGGTNSLVSVDALQEFRTQTSSFAPEFGRTPGGQISIVTRSGSNDFHGAIFDYLRNDVFDANDWFANNAGLPKPKERQNDFGGTLSGPILKNKTFFFFSYEGLRLRLPRTSLTTVPDASFTPSTIDSRQTASPPLQPYLKAFPLPNPTSPEILITCDPNSDPGCPSSGTKASGTAAFNATYSDTSSLDAYSLRLDHNVSGKVSLFGRYNYSPSSLAQRGFGGAALSAVSPSSITTQTATVGATLTISPQTFNDLRFNYSRTNSSSRWVMDSFGGAVPLENSPFPSPFSTRDSSFAFNVGGFGVLSIIQGKTQVSVQRQINIVDSVSLQRGRHGLKFGVDFRRLTPSYGPPAYVQQANFQDISSAESGSLASALVIANRGGTLLFRNLGVFSQDTWQVIPRLTVNYGLRWDVDVAPSSISGPPLIAVAGFNLNDPSKLALAAPSTAIFRTTYSNVAPRIGVAYQLSPKRGREAVIRGGFGAFYDLATQEIGNLIGQGQYPFGASNFLFGVPFSCPTSTFSFPLDPCLVAPPPITAATLGPPFGLLSAINPHLQLPYTLEWNVTFEQGLGEHQTLSASYVGSAGRRLIQTEDVFSPNQNFGQALMVGNSATSDYDSLQVQFQRHLSHNLQALASYTWSHSIDSASAGSAFGNPANAFAPTVNSNINRGPSDFDIRHALSSGLTYQVPALRFSRIGEIFLDDWSIESIVLARTASPLTVFDSSLFELFNAATSVRPDVIEGVPLYLHDSQFPGGKALNRVAFTDPPVDPNTGLPLRQGDLGRNALRGFAAIQWDFALHRDFALHESLKLQFRAELFNCLNHPNFGPPVSDLGNTSQFGRSIQMLAQSLSGNLGGGSFNPLYQIGGPRSVQFALKLSF